MKMSEFPPSMTTILVRSVEELFTNNGIKQVSHEVIPDDFHMSHEYFSVIGFAGEKVSGTINISSGSELLEVCHPGQAMGMNVGEAELADWLGELTNQIIGRFKNLMLKHEIEFTITTPTVFRGEKIATFDQKKSGAKQHLSFSLDEHKFLLFADVQIKSELNFDQQEAAQESQDEGTALFF
jgi:CheY-specific phosphatase CheX